jgi:hypothetical protein
MKDRDEIIHELDFSSLTMHGEQGGCHFCGSALGEEHHHPETAWECAHNPDLGDEGMA